MSACCENNSAVQSTNERTLALRCRLGGYASSSLSDVFKWSARAWGVGALLSLPIFDGGRREAGVKSASAQLDGATAQYRGQVLNALREVEDQLA